MCWSRETCQTGKARGALRTRVGNHCLRDITTDGIVRVSWKDMRAVTTPMTAPMANEPLKIPRKTPTDLKKAAASNVCVLAPLGW